MATLAVRILCQHVRLTMMSLNIGLDLKQCSKFWYKKGLKSWKTQKRLEAQLATVTELVTRLLTPSVASTSITSQPSNSRDLPSQALSIPRRSIPTLFLCANQEGREDAPLNEEDVENLNHEEVRECLEEVEEKNEDQEAEDVDHEVENKDKDGYLHKLHNNRAKVGALSSRKHLGPWQFQEKLVDSQNNGWTNQNTKSKHWWRFIASVEALRSLMHATWDTRDQCNNKNWWRFKEEFKHKPP
ncbi:hypothetical protein PIB30_063202 [Stylosanthes scabra]|uniref:Uncharacterized protein n=1 Tax=Stylosanthes scabra TaxID=79078 RepID=A0ABU6WP64_9FABA|nr:hypothetical protein [Stylosanthes scabra]